MIAVSEEYTRDLNGEREAIIYDNREILSFFQMYKMERIPSYSVDQLSSSLLPQDVPTNVIPLKATGNGNCFFNAASILLIGNESLHGVLRLLTAIEIFLHCNFYANHPRYVKSIFCKTGA